MRFLAFIRWLISLPLFWMGQLLGTIKSPMCLPLLKAAWRLSRDDQMGVATLRMVRLLESPESARVQAALWLEPHPRPGVACFAGMLALESGDLDNAARLRDLCRALGGDSDGFIDWLDLQLLLQLNDQPAIEDLYRRLEARRDLSALVSKTLLDHLLIRAMFSKNWDDVKRRADFLWNIESSPLPATALWVLSRRDGNAETLDRFLRKTRATPGQALYFEGMGHLILDEFELARHALDRLRGTDAAMADSLAAIIAQAGAA
jgi:hypothetical protein